MYIIIEKFPEPHIVTNTEGEILYFDDLGEAHFEASQCQDGIVVNLHE